MDVDIGIVVVVDGFAVFVLVGGDTIADEGNRT